jgi:hypothetical protein
VSLDWFLLFVWDNWFSGLWQLRII